MASVTRTAVGPLGNGVGYQLSSHESWAPDAVYASWDGSGASGEFLPAVSFYSAGGALIDRRWPQGVTLQPGDTADVSYGPFSQAEAGGAAPFAPLMEVFADTPLFHTSVAPGATVPLPWAYSSGPFLLNSFSVPTAPTVNAAGVYAFSFQVQHAVATVTAGTWVARLETVDGTALNVTATGTFASTSTIRSQAGAALVRTCAAGCTVRVNIFHNEAGAINFSLNAAVEQLA